MDMKLLYTIILVFLGVCILLALVRAITGKRIVDRIIGINMIGTLTMIAFAVLSQRLEQSYLLDVCLIYVLMSFIAVLTLCKIYISLDRQRAKEDEHHD
ncbi:MAG: sodium:proton antiporter [Ruminococcaceae bacterium]|nr:sodium:proton antiporter [Oscillospiraceae bacterium]